MFRTLKKNSVGDITNIVRPINKFLRSRNHHYRIKEDMIIKSKKGKTISVAPFFIIKSINIKNSIDTREDDTLNIFFSYILLSFCNVLIGRYRKRGSQFFINIIGTDPTAELTAIGIANIFANYIFQPKKKTGFNSDIKNTSLNRDTKFRECKEFFTMVNDFPIIVNNIEKSESLLKFICEEGLSAFPILVGKTIRHSNVLPLRLSKSQYSKNLYKDIDEPTLKIRHIVLFFIDFIQQAYAGNLGYKKFVIYDYRKKFFKECKRKTIPEKSKIDNEVLMPCVYLNYAFHLFISFGLYYKWISECTANQYNERATMIFQQIASVDDLVDQSNPETHDEYPWKHIPTTCGQALNLFREYIVDIFNNNITIPFHAWEGEARGDDRVCYNLEYNRYFDDFCKVKHIEGLGKKPFEEYLYSNDLINPRASKAGKGTIQYSRIKRDPNEKVNNKSPEYTVLAVIKSNIMGVSVEEQ